MLPSVKPTTNNTRVQMSKRGIECPSGFLALSHIVPRRLDIPRFCQYSKSSTYRSGEVFPSCSCHDFPRHLSSAFPSPLAL